jgi:hypothetical protein
VSIFRIYTMYEPLRVFVAAAGVVALLAMVVWVRFIVLFIQGNGSGHIQSVVLGSTLFVVAVQLAALGVIGDLLANNRVLIQRALERTRRIELKLGVEPSHYEPGYLARRSGAELAERSLDAAELPTALTEVEETVGEAIEKSAERAAVPRARQGPR